MPARARQEGGALWNDLKGLFKKNKSNNNKGEEPMKKSPESNSSRLAQLAQMMNKVVGSASHSYKPERVIAPAGLFVIDCYKIPVMFAILHGRKQNDASVDVTKVELADANTLLDIITQQDVMNFVTFDMKGHPLHWDGLGRGAVPASMEPGVGGKQSIGAHVRDLVNAYVDEKKMRNAGNSNAGNKGNNTGSSNAGNSNNNQGSSNAGNQGSSNNTGSSNAGNNNNTGSSNAGNNNKSNNTNTKVGSNAGQVTTAGGGSNRRRSAPKAAAASKGATKGATKKTPAAAKKARTKKY